MATLKELIEAEPALANMDYPGVAAWFETQEMIKNPSEKRRIQAPVTLEQVMAIVPDAEAAKCYRLPGLIEDMRKAMDTNNHAWLGKLLGIALADGAITQATAAELRPLLTDTIDDGSWSEYIADVPRWRKLGLVRAPTAIDVMFALQLSRDLA